MPSLRRTVTGLATIAVALALAAPAAATPAAHEFNAWMSGDISRCVKGRSGAPLYAFDGSWTYNVIYAPESPCSYANEYRVQVIDTLRIGGQKMYMNRGGGSFSQRHGHIPATWLTTPPATNAALAHGNGRAPASCPGPTVYNDPKPLSISPFRYKTASETGGNNTFSSWSNYADPGGQPVHYNYLLWNLPRVGFRYIGEPWSRVNPGGGIPRVTIKRGQAVVLCDVSPLYNEAFDAGEQHIGTTVWRYAGVINSDWTVVYGWLFTEYHRFDNKTMTRMTSATPLP